MSSQPGARLCPSCGATNIGPQMMCLLCQAGLPEAGEPRSGRPLPGEPAGSGRGSTVPPGMAASPVPPPVSLQTGPKFCPNCGQPPKPGVRFCTNCGHQLAG